MKILYIDHYAGSLSMGMEFRPYYLAREWQRMGHEVRIVAADFTHLRRKNADIQDDFEIQQIDGVKFQFVHTIEYSGNGANRALSIFQFCLKLWKNAKQIAREFQPNVVISSSTYPLDTYPAKRIADFSGATLIHETHDIWPLTLTAVGGMSRFNPFVIIMAIAEKRAYRVSRTVIGILPDSYKHMLKHGLQSKDKFVHIPNGVVIDDWKSPTLLDSEHKTELDNVKKNSDFIVMYTGSLELSYSLDLMLDAAKLVKTEQSVKNTSFVYVGKGNIKEHLKQRIKEEKIDNAFVLNPVSKDAMPSLLDYADALYIGLSRNPLYHYGVSMNKIYDYMMSAKPIIYGIECSNNEIDTYKCGVSIEPDNAEAIIKAIKKIRSLDAKEVEQMGQNGRNAIYADFDYKVLAQKFLEAIK